MKLKIIVEFKDVIHCLAESQIITEVFFIIKNYQVN